jgi:hypothetical protein
MPIIYNGSDRPPVQLFYMIFLYIYIQKKCIEEDIIMSIKSCIAFEPQLKRDMKRLAIDREDTKWPFDGDVSEVSKRRDYKGDYEIMIKERVAVTSSQDPYSLCKYYTRFQVNIVNG